MLKTILVPMTGFDCDKVALESAFLTGRPFEAHLECLYIHPGSRQLLSRVAATDMPAVIEPDLFEVMRRDDKARSEKAHQTFDDFRKHRNISIVEVPPGPQSVTATWRERVGDDIDETIDRARVHDLIVFGRAPDFAPLSPYAIGSILVSCGRPALLAPTDAPTNLFATIAVAWKSSPQAAQAVTAAMPLLEKASRILVLQAIENGDERDCMESAEQLSVELRWHGLLAESRCVVPGGRKIPDAVMDTARELGADLMVMGAYGHSRIRELVFGGFTWHALNQAPLPVLMFH